MLLSGGESKMNWIDDTQKAINYIESNLTENITADDVSNHVHSSTDYFQRTFNIVTGLSISEYMRNRRLTLAGDEIKNTQAKIIDVSLKYGYDSPESFTKSFTRFNGVTPTAIRVSGSSPKYFHPLSIKIYIRGGFGMKRKIIPNIPELSNYGNPVDCLLNVIDATFAVAGAGKGPDKGEMAAYSGMGNRFVWKAGAWEHGCEDMESIDTTPFESKIRLMKAMGWEAKYVEILRDKDGKPLNYDNEQIRQDFIDAIDRGYPVLARNKDHYKYNIIFGYDDNGNKVISKDAPDTVAVTVASETNIRENWEDTIGDYIVLKGKTELAPERERALGLFKLITGYARRTNEINGLKVGFAAWDSYLHDLEFDDFSQLSVEEVGIEGRMGVFCDGLCQIYARLEPLPYYRSLAEKFPEWRDELETAIAAMDICARYAEFFWAQGLSVHKKDWEKFRDPALRKIIADEGRRTYMQKDIEAIEQFEKILEKEGIE